VSEQVETSESQRSRRSGRSGRSGVRRSGTRSTPDGPRGRQRARRHVVNQPPRQVPCTSNASKAYAEHDGKKRHGESRPLNARWYQRMPARARRCVQVGALTDPALTDPVGGAASAARATVMCGLGRAELHRGGQRHESPVRRTSVRQLEDDHRTATGRSGHHDQRGLHASCDGGDCASQRSPGRD